MTPLVVKTIVDHLRLNGWQSELDVSDYDAAFKQRWIDPLDHRLRHHDLETTVTADLTVLEALRTQLLRDQVPTFVTRNVK